MPHQCTNCGHTFPDGSKEMLSGCPDCGGNKFQFTPSPDSRADSGADGDGGPETETPPSGSESRTASEGVASRAADTVRDWVSSGSTDESSGDTGDSPSPPESAASAPPSDPEPQATGADSSPTPTPDETTSVDRIDGPSDDRDGNSFTEWPDSARRPEDRSSSPDESAADDVDDRSVPRSSTGTDEPTTGSRPEAAEGREFDHETATVADSEDSAQASARSEVVPADDLPSGSSGAEAGDPITEVDPIDDGESESEGEGEQAPDHGRVVSEPSGDQPSIEELRAELNEQFESIKILRPGQYELNLMELYNRDEYIISLQEDGRYVIDVPESWHDDADE